MEKKEEKLKDINDLLKREIEPQMEKLRKVHFFDLFEIFILKKEKETYLLWKSGEMELNRLTKILSAYEYFSKSTILTNLQNEIEELRVIDSRNKQNRESSGFELSQIEKKISSYENEKRRASNMNENKGSLDQKFNEKQKQIIQLESEMKNMLKNLQTLEEEQTNREAFRKQNKSKLAKMAQMIDFSNITLKEYEDALREKKAQFEEAKRNLQGSKGGGNNLEEAYESVKKQLEIAEKKMQENQNHIHALNQKIFQVQEQLEVEQSAFEMSVNNRYFSKILLKAFSFQEK